MSGIPISPAMSVSSPCRPNENTIEQGEDDEECIVFDEEEESLVLSSSDAGDMTHSTSWDVDLEQDVAKVVVKDQSAASFGKWWLQSFWKETPLPDTPTMNSNAAWTVSLLQKTRMTSRTTFRSPILWNRGFTRRFWNRHAVSINSVKIPTKYNAVCTIVSPKVASATRTRTKKAVMFKKHPLT